MTPLVAVVMGSRSDWETMEHCVQTLRELEVSHEVRVLSAHRTPDALETFVADVEGRGCQVLVAAAGGAAHLAGVVASQTLLPVLGVPMGTQLGGLDSLLSTVQMPAGVSSRRSPSGGRELARRSSPLRSWPARTRRSRRGSGRIARSRRRRSWPSPTRAPCRRSEARPRPTS